jgi:hypothetical protein
MIDSPLGGITSLARFFGLAQNGYCPVLQDLRDRSVRAAVWQPWLRSSANYLLSRNVQLAAVANPEDGVVLYTDQQIDAPVNFPLAYLDSGLNHSAIINTPAALTTIASWIRSWLN